MTNKKDEEHDFIFKIVLIGKTPSKKPTKKNQKRRFECRQIQFIIQIHQRPILPRPKNNNWRRICNTFNYGRQQAYQSPNMGYRRSRTLQINN